MSRGNEKPEDSELTESRARELELSGSEQRAIGQVNRTSAVVIHEIIRIDGELELRRGAISLMWSGLAAGLSMGLSMVAEGLIHTHLPDQPWRPLLSHLGYSVGFLVVVLGRQQLFTENTLTPVLPLLSRRDAPTFWRVLRLWAIVLVSNLIGTLMFASVAGSTDIFSPEARQAFAEISVHVIEGGFWTNLGQGVVAGWLIALMVWLLPGVQFSQVIVIVIFTYLVRLAGLLHCVAGSVETFYLITTGATTWGAYLEFIIPALVGNTIGGVALVAILNYGQIAPRPRTGRNFLGKRK